jgi:hypothetical protein
MPKGWQVEVPIGQQLDRDLTFSIVPWLLSFCLLLFFPLLPQFPQSIFYSFL